MNKYYYQRSTGIYLLTIEGDTYSCKETGKAKKEGKNILKNAFPAPKSINAYDVPTDVKRKFEKKIRALDKTYKYIIEGEDMGNGYESFVAKQKEIIKAADEAMRVVRRDFSVGENATQDSKDNIAKTLASLEEYKTKANKALGVNKESFGKYENQIGDFVGEADKKIKYLKQMSLGTKRTNPLREEILTLLKKELNG